MEIKSYDKVDRFIQEGSSGSNFICICGSSKFFFEVMECQRILTSHDWIVLSKGFWSDSFSKYSRHLFNINNHKRVKRLQYKKIYHSDALLVVTDYIGYLDDDTKDEIAFAKFLKMPIIYYNGEYFVGKDDTDFSNCIKHGIQFTEEIIDEFEAKLKTD